MKPGNWSVFIAATQWKTKCTILLLDGLIAAVNGNEIRYKNLNFFSIEIKQIGKYIDFISNETIKLNSGNLGGLQYAIRMLLHSSAAAINGSKHFFRFLLCYAYQDLSELISFCSFGNNEYPKPVANIARMRFILCQTNDWDIIFIERQRSSRSLWKSYWILETVEVATKRNSIVTGQCLTIEEFSKPVRTRAKNKSKEQFRFGSWKKIHIFTKKAMLLRASCIHKN